MVVTPGIVAVGGEETPLVDTLEGDAEVVAVRVDGRAHVLDVPVLGAVEGRTEDVEATHSGVSVGGKIQRYRVSDIGKQFITRCVYLGTKVLHGTEVVAVDACPEDVLTPLPTHGVGDEVEPAAVGGDRRVSEGSN